VLAKITIIHYLSKAAISGNFIATPIKSLSVGVGVGVFKMMTEII
jgi:hypothetical protein